MTQRWLTAEEKAAGSALVTSVEAVPQAPKCPSLYPFVFWLNSIYAHIKLSAVGKQNILSLLFLQVQYGIERLK